jgi:hypothetical protein
MLSSTITLPTRIINGWSGILVGGVSRDRRGQRATQNEPADDPPELEAEADPPSGRNGTSPASGQPTRR